MTGSSHAPENRRNKKFAVITGASSGIGYELAKQFAEHGFDLLIAARGDELLQAADRLRKFGVTVDPAQVDLATEAGVRELYATIACRPVDALVLNAGVVNYGEFARTPELLDKELQLVRLNVESVVHLSKLVLPEMVERGEGRVLITSSVAAEVPGALYSTYAASKAFLLLFAEAIRSEMKSSGVSVTILMPPPTETGIFNESGMSQTVVGKSKKSDPASVAKIGFDCLMSGKEHAIPGLFGKLTHFGAPFLPARVLAILNRAMLHPA